MARQRLAARVVVGDPGTEVGGRARAVAVLIRGAVAADFRKGEKTREQIADLMAGGESMASLEASIEGYMESHEGHVPPPAH